MRCIRTMATAAVLATSLGAVVGGTIAIPSAHAQTVTMSLAKGTVTASTHAADGSKPVVGVNLYVNENYSLDDVKTWGARDLKYIHDTLGLKAVAIDWDYNVPNRYADVVRASDSRTPTIADIRTLTDIAQSYGMRVEYRVLFAINNSDSRDGSIEPRNLSDWLDWLLATETPALKLADNEGVPEFVVGSEMASIDQSPRWGKFLTDAAKIYKGILSYAQWGGRTWSGGFFSQYRVLLPTAEYGASAYPPIALPPDASVKLLTKAWEDFLTDHTPDSLLRRTAIDEIGIPALAGSYENPWQWDNLTGTADPAIQARWFTAACDAVTAEHMRGIYFWSFALNDDPAKPYDSLVGFLGRPASLDAIKSC